MPSLPTIRHPRNGPVRRTAKLAMIWGLSYLVPLIGVPGAFDLPPDLRTGTLTMSLLFAVIGTLELWWRHEVLKTGSPRPVRLLAGNEMFGMAVLIGSIIWVYVTPVSSLVKLMSTPETMKLTRQMGVTAQSIALSMKVAKFGTLCFGAPLLLWSQVYVVIQYRRLAREIEHEAALPPVLA